MVTKRSRDVSVSLTSIGLRIGFLWFETDEQGKLNHKMIHVESADPVQLEAFRQHLNKIGGKMHIACTSNNRMSVIYEYPETLGQVYDIAVSSENPLAVFTTPYEVIPMPHQEPASV
jgi:hypothetical protein